MSNILNHNRKIFEFDINKEDYWDFQLCIDNASTYCFEGISERCLSTYIDISDDECVWFDNIYSKNKYVWEKAINVKDFSFNSFGYTSVDNGMTYYEKDRITNKEFFEIFTNTTYKPQEDDLRLTLTKVRGNHKLYDYTNDITFWEDKFQVAKLNGGWFQGFFCANDGSQYKTLPTSIGEGWNLEFVLNKEDFVNDKETLNDKYPENKGIFFYIGTRAENKWWVKYLTNHDFEWCKQNGFVDGYVEDEYTNCDGLNDAYFKDIVDMYEHSEYFSDEYLVMEKEKFVSSFMDEYTKDNKFCEECNTYVEEGYVEEDLHIDDDMKLETEEGFDLYQPNIFEIKTDNKFMIFDRTCKGAKANKWDENTEYVFNFIKKPNIGNYFTLFHRGCGGYDTNKIEDVLNIKNKEYNVLQDIYRNAFALQIKDNGTIGYKYMVKDCESEEENYKIESEFTLVPIIKEKTWYTINVKIMPIKQLPRNTNCMTQTKESEKMKIYIYVNGKLVLVSKEIPMLNLKLLNDLQSKQEGVPFNISLGGGTQGLAEVVYLNYMKPPEYTLPLEKEFGGSFVGWFKTFRFYTCPLMFNEIVENHNFSKII